MLLQKKNTDFNRGFINKVKRLTNITKVHKDSIINIIFSAWGLLYLYPQKKGK
jgi:hypothetical protein